MNALRSVLFLDFNKLGWTAKKTRRLQLVLLFLFALIAVLFSYNFDWKKWISIGSFLLVIKLGFNVSLGIVNARKNSNYRLKDLVKWLEPSGTPDRKAASKLLGRVVLVLGLGVALVMYGSYQLLENQIDNNGITVRGVKEDMYWRSTSKESAAGFYMEYCYRVDGKKYQNRAQVGRKSNVKRIQVKYLPYLPNVHKVTFKKQ